MNHTRFQPPAALFLMALVVTGCSTSTATRARVAGTYEHCLMSCLTIELREDGTFLYKPMGDVGVQPSVEGVWEFLESDIVRANSHDQPHDSFPILLRRDPAQVEIIVRVLDVEEPGAPIPGATVTIECNWQKQSRVTDIDGLVSFPACELSFAVLTDLSRWPWSDKKSMTLRLNDACLLNDN